MSIDTEIMLRKEVSETSLEVSGIIIDSPEAYEFASDQMYEILGLKKKIQSYWKPEKDQAHKLHKAICDKEKDMLCLIDQEEKALRKKINAYLTEVEKKREEEQAKLNAKLEAERAEKEKQCENTKTENPEVEGIKIPVVTELQAVVIPEVEKTLRSDKGTASASKVTVVTVTDPMAIIKAVANGELPAHLIEIKENELKKYIDTLKLKELAGCEINEEVNASFRTKIA